jgi:hypothetical protein
MILGVEPIAELLRAALSGGEANVDGIGGESEFADDSEAVKS